MQCKNWDEMVIDRLAGELGEEDSILLEQHLAECPRCRQEEIRLRELLDAQRRQEDGTPGEGMLARLLDVMRGGTEREPRLEIPIPQSGRRAGSHASFNLAALFRRPLPSYAALLLVFMAMGGGIWIGRSAQPESTSAWRPSQSPAPPAVGHPTEATDSPSLPPATGAAGDHLADASVPGRDGSSFAGFVSARPDAMDLPMSVPRDSL
jgi:hypothetical protein